MDGDSEASGNVNSNLILEGAANQSPSNYEATNEKKYQQAKKQYETDMHDIMEKLLNIKV